MWKIHRTGRRRNRRPQVKGSPPLSWGSQVIEGLEDDEHDFVVTKRGRSCFGSTPLHRILRNLGVRRCIVTGGGIYGCVEDSVPKGVGLN